MTRTPAAAVFTTSVWFAVCTLLQAASPPPLYSIGEPSDEEQVYLELINRARANPAAEGARLATTTDREVLAAYASFGVNLALMKSEFEVLTVRPPLAFNSALNGSARAHSQDMFDNAFQGHTGSSGSTMGSRVTAAGYVWTAIGENVFSYAKSAWHGHAGFQVDWGYGTGGMQAGRGHRASIHGNFREIGIGAKTGFNSSGGTTIGPQIVTQDFCNASGSGAFVTGVAYYDLNGNQFYDAGEGIGGLAVQVSGASYSAVTSTSGGFTVPVAATTATRTVSFTGPGLAFTTSVSTPGGINAKADFTPTYSAPVITAPTTVLTMQPNRLTFTEVGGAVGYDGQHSELVAITADRAENLNEVTAAVTGSYSPLSTSAKHEGEAAYRLAHGTTADQTLTYKSGFHVEPGAGMQFRSRLGYASSSQVAQVEVSTDEGKSWRAVYSQPGSDGSGESDFTLRSVSLSEYHGRIIHLRLRYSFSTGTYYPGTGSGLGWSVDDLSFTGISRLINPVTTSLGAVCAFDFIPPTPGRHVLAVRGRLPGRYLAYGPALVIQDPSSTLLSEIAVEQPADTPLSDNGPTMLFGNQELGTSSSAKTFTIRNTGTANLTGIAVTLSGNTGDFILSGPATSALAPDADTTFTVVFRPTTAGSRSAALWIASNDADENPFDISLTGTGAIAPQPLLPQITVEQPAGTPLSDNGAAMLFGNQELGASSSAKTFTIRNTGTANLTDIAVTLSGNTGDFILSGPATSALAPNTETTFTLIFRPTTAGSRSAALRIASNGADENPFDIQLTGTGLTVDPFTLAIVGTPFGPRVGHQLTLDLTRLAYPGETIKLVGKLPSGLKFNATNGMFSGVITGSAGRYPLTVQFLQGKTVLRTVSLPITVLPYPATLLGSFEGLLENGAGIPTGVFRLTITKPGAWSATLEGVGMTRRSAKGSFLLDQQSPTIALNAVFPASRTLPAESVSVQLNADSPMISGTYANGTLRGFRIAQGMEIPASGAMCNLALDPGAQDGIAAPAGIGWLAGKFGTTGSASFRGSLGDGTSASVSLRMSATGQALLWLQPYANKLSFLGGIVTLPDLGQSPASSERLQDSLWWSKAVDARTLSYTAGFAAMPVDAYGARWTAPATATLLGSALGWADGRTASLFIEGAGLSNADPQGAALALPTALTLDDRFNLNATAPAGVTRVAWLGKVTSIDGKWTGTLSLPIGFAPDILAGNVAVSGVLLPGTETSGCGYIKVPVPGSKGSFRTAAAILGD